MKNESGAIFLSTMISLLVMVIVGGSIFNLTSQDLFFVNHLKKSTQAKQLAEAGLAQACAKLKANWTSNTTYPQTNIGPGSYQATVATSGGRTLVTSVGSVQGISRSASAEVIPPAVSAFNYAIASGGSGVIDAGTGQSPGVINGSVYSHGSLSLDGPSSGGALVINGSAVTASSSLAVSSSVTLTGTQTTNYATTVPFPSVDLNYYQTIASANGQYFAGSKVYNSGQIPAAPAGGVIYVSGSCTIYGAQTTNATLVVGGSLAIQKTGNNYPKVTVTKADGMPAMIVMGSMAYQSNGNGGSFLNVTGLLYTGGSFSFQSGNHDQFTLNGSLVSLGSISISPQSQNTLTINYISQNPPGFTIPPSQFGIESYNT